MKRMSKTQKQSPSQEVGPEVRPPLLESRKGGRELIVLIVMYFVYIRGRNTGSLLIAVI